MDFRNRRPGETLNAGSLHEGHRHRLRTTLVANGWENVPEHQILEYMLTCVQPRKDTNPLAHRLIDEFGSLANVLDASPQDLMTIKGVGNTIATFLSSYPYIFKLHKKSKLQTGIDCSSPRRVFENYGKVISHMPNEEFYLICVDGDSKAITAKMINRGSKNEVQFTLKSICETALRNQAFGVILLHNHPNADCRPSQEDIEMTRKIYYSLYMNGIYVLDHLITCKNESYFSFANGDYFKNFELEAKVLMGEAITKANAKRPKYETNKGDD